MRTRSGPEAGEWLQQATLAIRAHVPLDVLRDTIQPFPTFSEIYADALKALRADDRRRRLTGVIERRRDCSGRPSWCSAAAPASGSRPPDAHAPRGPT